MIGVICSNEFVLSMIQMIGIFLSSLIDFLRFKYKIYKGKNEKISRYRIEDNI
jgi:hypothetical protein